MVKFDDILEEINEFGAYQRLRFGLLCIAAMLPGIVTYIHSFMAPKPDYICNQSEFGADVSYTNITYDKCSYYLDGEAYPCSQWSFDKTYYRTTLTEDWSMVCDRSFYRQYVQMVYFSGYIVGSLVLGYLADVFGRRPIMLSSFVIILLGGIGVAFGPQEAFGFKISILIYTISRFLIACGTRGINVTGYILALEIVGPSHRAYAAMVFTSFFAIGQLFLVFMAYFIRDWRTLAGVMVIPLVPFLGYFFVISESPRWLISKNRTDEAYAILEKISKTNKRKLSHDTWATFVKENDILEETTIKESAFDVAKSPKLLILTLTMFLHWIVNNLTFYGIGLKSNDLGVNPYLTFFISATVELFSYILSSFAITKFGRKIPYIICLFIAGVSCVAIYFLENNVILTVVLAMIGKFAIAASYAIIHLYSSEVFPTTVRGTCQGACSMMARFGSIIAPGIISLDDVYKGLPFLVFGITALIATLTSSILPETGFKKLPKNLSEAENIKTMKCLPNTYYKKDEPLNEF